jgi:hypothetical protein
VKNLILGGIIIFAVGLLAPQTAWSQGTLTYLSSLGQPSFGSAAVGSDSWVAGFFATGNNAGGYALDSVQLAMTPASGAPNGFEVMLYSVVGLSGPFPGSSLGTLSGSSDPETGGLYTYTASGLMLSPSTQYYIVVTAGTSVANGAYAWSVANSPPDAIGGWSGDNFLLTSSDGSSWNITTGDPQFALTATAVPEPGTIALLGLSGLLFFASRRWRAKAQPPIAW